MDSRAGWSKWMQRKLDKGERIVLRAGTYRITSTLIVRR
jgi:hypothetical protein